MFSISLRLPRRDVPRRRPLAAHSTFRNRLTSISFAEKGGTAALQDPAFYSQLGGSASALVVDTSVAVGVTVLASETGPAAPFIGAGAGAVTGAAAYIAGEHATNEFLREFYPSL